MTRRTSNDLLAVFAETGRRKSEAAQHRQSRSSTEPENSRDVYLSACEAIARPFLPVGFKYAKSGPHLSRTHGLFIDRISFQSSHNNIPGQHVCLWMHAFVRCKRLREWRKGLSPTMATDFVAGGMVHRLRGVHAMVEWELADPATRDDVIADAVEFVRSDVLPYFARFESPEALMAELAERSIPALELRASVELSLCFGDRNVAQRVLDRFVAERTDLHDAIANVEANGLKNQAHGPGGYAEEVVFLRRAYQLK